MLNAVPDPEPFLPLYATQSEIDTLQEAIRFLQQSLKRAPEYSSQRMRLLYRLERVQVSLTWQLQELRLLLTLVHEQRPLVSQMHHLLHSQNAVQQIYLLACRSRDEETIQWAAQEMQAHQLWFARCGFALRFAECLQQWVITEGEAQDVLA